MNGCVLLLVKPVPKPSFTPFCTHALTVTNAREARLHSATEFARLRKARTGETIEPEQVVKVRGVLGKVILV